MMPNLTKEQFIIAALTGDMPTLIQGCKYYSATEDTISKEFNWLSWQLYMSRIRANPLWMFSSLNKKLVKAVDTDFVRGNKAVKTYGVYHYTVNEFNTCGSATNSDLRFYSYSALIAAVLGDNDKGLAYLLNMGAKPDITISKIVVSIEGESEAPDPVNNYEGRYDAYKSNKQITDVTLLKLAEMLHCNKVATLLRQRLESTCDAAHKRKRMCTLQ